MLCKNEHAALWERKRGKSACSKRKTLPSLVKGRERSLRGATPVQRAQPSLFPRGRRRKLRRFRRRAPYTQTRRMSFALCPAEALQQNGSLSVRCKSGTASASQSVRHAPAQPRAPARSACPIIGCSFSSGSSCASQDRRAANQGSAFLPWQDWSRREHYRCRTGAWCG